MGTVAGRGHQATAAPSNIPRHLTSFVGRDAELRALKAMLGDSPLVTIIGTGGAGKTTLPAQVTRGGVGRWPDGIWWIDLAGADDVLGSVIANAELPGRGHPIDIVTSWLAPRRALLVLDNCEHLIAESADFCHSALERCPELTILATSREALGVPGEARWPLTSLAETEALELFEARARLVLPEFKATPQVATIARICDRLDRLPLAIEMASARLDMMSERELLQNLDDRFRVLDSGARTAPERQQTMAATIDWSHRLLNEDEARIFRRLAVFQGGLTMGAAQAVFAEATDRSVLGLVSGLVKKSMVVAERLHDGSTRYRLLESHHDFAGERLKESGELDAVQRRHYDYFSSRRWEPVESANFWHAVSWARDNAGDHGLGLAIEIGDADFGDQSRAGNLILDLLEYSKPSDTLRVKALTMAARLAWRQADLAASRDLSDAAVAMARKVGDSELLARALNGAGIAHEQTGELALAGQMYDEALSLLSDSTNQRLAADVSNTSGLLAIEQGDPARALEILSSCVAFATSQNDRPLMAIYLDTLANAQLDLGDIDGATASWTESLSMFRVVNDWFGIIWAMGGLSLVAAARREDERALRLAAAADRLSRQYSLGAWRFRVDQLDAACEKARNRLGTKGRGEAAWKQGQAMTTGEALNYALHPDGSVEDTPVDAGPLSRREREVATMVASGMTNKEIAQRLFIAERTAEGHLERIRNKLGVRSRTEVATWAVAHGLGQPPLDKPPAVSKV